MFLIKYYIGELCELVQYFDDTSKIIVTTMKCVACWSIQYHVCLYSPYYSSQCYKKDVISIQET